MYSKALRLHSTHKINKPETESLTDSRKSPRRVMKRQGKLMY